jgi:hypothetical protein
MEDRVGNLRLTIEGCRRLLLLEEQLCARDLEALRRFLTATEAELAHIENQREETITVEERSRATQSTC